MAKQASPLTARQVETRKAPGLIADGGGLYLQIAPTGARTWIYRYQIAGRRRDMGWAARPSSLSPKRGTGRGPPADLSPMVSTLSTRAGQRWPLQGLMPPRR